MFIQVSTSDFQVHNSKASKDIRNAFVKPMTKAAGMTDQQVAKRNQIEIYLDEMFGTSHSTTIDPTTHKFIVHRNGSPVPGFRIVYIRGSPFFFFFFFLSCNPAYGQRTTAGRGSPGTPSHSKTSLNLDLTHAEWQGELNLTLNYLCIVQTAHACLQS